MEKNFCDNYHNNLICDACNYNKKPLIKNKFINNLKIFGLITTIIISSILSYLLW